MGSIFDRGYRSDRFRNQRRESYLAATLRALRELGWLVATDGDSDPSFCEVKETEGALRTRIIIESSAALETDPQVYRAGRHEKPVLDEIGTCPLESPVYEQYKEGSWVMTE